MSILPATAPGCKAGRPHDPLVCGLDWDTDCDTCHNRAQANYVAQCRRDVANNRWRRLLVANRLLRRLNLPSERLPAADAGLLAGLVVLLLDPDTWEVLAELMLDALCDVAPALEEYRPHRVTEIHDAALAYIDTLRGGQVRPEHEPHEVVTVARDERVYSLLLALERNPEAAQALARILARVHQGGEN